MRWRGGRRSRNIEDRRGSSYQGGSGRGGGAGLLKLLPLLFRFLGFKGGIAALVVIGVVTFFSGGLDTFLGGSPRSGLAPQPRSGSAPPRQSSAERELAEFVSVVLADTEDTWHKLFRQMGRTYREPTLVLYRAGTRTACGTGRAAMGPFYCPGDRKVYIDLSFFDDLQRRFKAPGDFAQAYVVAHEIGHHVQTLLGVSGKVHKAKQGLTKTKANRLSVRQELQADCFAGIWAHHAKRSRNLLEAGDLEEGLTAASAIGDDRLQRQSTGRVAPDSFTHGSSKQRVRWFRIGYEQGTLKACDTFAASSL